MMTGCLIMSKKYSFDLVLPAGMKNDWIVVSAKNKKEGKKKLLKELAKLNRKLIQVSEFDPIERKLKQ